MKEPITDKEAIKESLEEYYEQLNYWDWYGWVYDPYNVYRVIEYISRREKQLLANNPKQSDG